MPVEAGSARRMATLPIATALRRARQTVASVDEVLALMSREQALWMMG